MASPCRDWWLCNFLHEHLRLKETNQGEDEEEEMGVAETYADYVPAKCT